MCEYLKLVNQKNKPSQKFEKSAKLPPYERTFFNVNRKGLYFVWVGLEKRKTKN